MPMRLLGLALSGLVMMGVSPLHAAEVVAPPGPAAVSPSAPEGSANQASPAVSLSLAEAIRLAHERSPLVRMAEAGVTEADARLRSARALDSPVLTLAHNTGSSEVATDEGVLVAQTIEVGQKRAAPIRGAQAERGAAAAEAERTGLELTRAAQEAYYQALRAEAERGLALEALHVSQAFEQAAETQFQAGEVARNQVVRSQIDVAIAQQEAAAAETARSDRYAELRSLLGFPESTSLALTDTLEATPRAYALSDLMAVAVQARPDLRAARLQQQVREAEVQAARAQSRPDLIWEVRHDAIGAGGESGVRVGVSLPLLDLGRRRAGVQAARAALAAQQATTDESVRRARLEVETALHALDLARDQLASFETGRVSRAKELLSMAQTGYERGASSYLEVVDAEQAYRREQVAYVQAQAAYHLALAALEEAVGGTLP